MQRVLAKRERYPNTSKPTDVELEPLLVEEELPAVLCTLRAVRVSSIAPTMIGGGLDNALMEIHSKLSTNLLPVGSQSTWPMYGT